MMRREIYMTFTENLLGFFIPKEKEDNKCGCYCEKVYAIEEKYLELKKIIQIQRKLILLNEN